MNSKYIFFPVIIIMLNILLLLCIVYLNFIHTQQIVANNLQTNNSVNLYFEGQNIPSIRNVISENPELTVYEKLDENVDEQIWGIAGNCEISNTIRSIINGRFFENDDFFNNKFVAVVGKNILFMQDKIITDGDKSFYKFNNKYYEIIGTISSNISSTLDNVVYINLDSVGNFFYHLIIDSYNKEVVNDAFSRFLGKYTVRAINEDNNFIKRYIYSEHSIRFGNIALIIFFIISWGVLIVLISRFYKSEIKVKDIIGFSKRSIIISIGCDIGLYVAISILITALLTALISYCNNIYTLDSYIISCILMILASVIIMIILSFYIISVCNKIHIEGCGDL